MPNDRPEFRPIEAAPSRAHLWPYAVLGAIIAGLLIWIPLAITIWVLELIVSTMDQSLLLLPEQGPLLPLKWLPEIGIAP